MKIDRRNPLHWWYLAASGTWAVLAVLLRPMLRRDARVRRVLLYGHKLGGNLLALQRYLDENHPEVEVVYLTLDPAYYRELAARGVCVALATSPRCLRWLITAEAMVTDHGLHALWPLLRFSDMKFFDVWHGIPFKGFDAADFRVQHRYHGVWVASELLRDLYVGRFGFNPEIVHVTGYARTDCLVNGQKSPDAIKRDLGLDPSVCGKLVLFAPTWKQDFNERALFPFGVEPGEFLQALSALAGAAGATILVRFHLNSGQTLPTELDRVAYVPYARYPDTEAVLSVTDVLVCDWSSIAFDFLLLDRPTLFLDVEPPFRKGFSLGPEYRYGAVVRSLPELLSQLETCLSRPEAYWGDYRERHVAVKQNVYGDYADGRSAERCAEKLLSWPV